MSDTSLNEILDLMRKSREEGVEVIVADQKITLKTSRQKKIDPDLINRFKLFKDDILLYFNRESEDISRSGMHVPSIEKDGRLYFEITPTQLYWINNDLDKEYKEQDKGHGSTILMYKLEGAISGDSFERAVMALVERHESLRANFERVGDAYRMAIASADLPAFKPSILNVAIEKDEKQVQSFLQFRDYTFDMAILPLFQCRLCRIKELEYILSIKLHHVIFDTMSSQVLLRDLFSLYVETEEKRPSALPALTFQYKEYLAYENQYTKKNAAEHKQYWHRIFQHLHDEILIPGNARKNATAVNSAGKEYFDYGPESTARLVTLSRAHSTSLFEILQMTLKSYLFCTTGKTRLVIGSYVFGRDYPGAEHQVGCYAKTVLIRTDLEGSDTLERVIWKVKRANEDMRRYRAYTLMEASRAMLPEGKESIGCFWNINMQFNDSGRGGSGTKDVASGPSSAGSLSVTVLPDLRADRMVSIDLELEIRQLGSHLELCVVYSHGIYDAKVIQDFFAGYLRFSKYILDHPSAVLQDLRVKQVW
ncbi:MAG TPA: condensation domain-containing protein [Puia sp.]|nr:condensation domain-containing protein [Puia sp.]